MRIIELLIFEITIRYECNAKLLLERLPERKFPQNFVNILK